MSASCAICRAVVVDVEVDDARVDDHVPHEPAEERHRHAALQPEHERLPRRELLAADEEGRSESASTSAARTKGRASSSARAASHTGGLISLSCFLHTLTKPV